jgi:hypothetical protein
MSSLVKAGGLIMENNKNIVKSISIRSKNSNVSNLLNSVNESQFSRESFKENFKMYGQKSYITEANKIMKERMKNKGNAITSKHRMRNLVMNDTRDICLKNYLIGLLKESRTDLNEKEKNITKALRDSENRLDTDYRNFIDFVEGTKKKQKREEEELVRLKTLHEEKDNLYKKECLENKKLYEELEKTVKMICLLKSYGSFVHRVLNMNFELDNIPDIDPRERNFESVGNTLLKKFNIMNSNKKIDELLEDDNFMMMKFNDYEIKVVKELEKKEVLYKNQVNLTDNYNEEIEELKRRYDDCLEESKSIENEKKEIQNQINKLKPHKNSDLNQYLDYIVELGLATGDLNNRLKGKKNFMDLLSFTKETLLAIERKELAVNEYIAEIEDIEENGDKQLIHEVELDRKRTNKREKQLQIKEKQDEIENIKRQRAVDRAQRVVIIGRKVPKEYPIIKGKKKKNNDNKNQEDDDYGMLYYSSDENEN